MVSRLVVGLGAVLALLLGAVSPAAQGPPEPSEAETAPDPRRVEHFEKQIRPLLLKRCTACHGPKLARAGLRLDTRAGFLRGGESGPLMVPGKADESAFIRSISYAGDLKMPPAGKLPDAEIALLTAWVRDGAVWGHDASEMVTVTGGAKPLPDPLVTARNHWAYQPVKSPPLPRVQSPWIRTPIDAFILAGLRARGLSPAPPADRRTLIRRVTFDLTGLPPRPEEVEEFLNDRRPDAWSRLVDRLLASKAYGERWGRHWLDVARYADSNGLDENTAFANAWRYRDYVIDSLNADKPYDLFVKEQIAGDLLPPDADFARQRERIVATGFLVLGPKVLAEPDKQKMVMDIVDEQIDVISKAFLATTLSCARCHDHKFDPFSTRDYYALAGILKSTRTMATLTTVAKAYERPLTDPETNRKFEAHRKALEEAQAQLKAESNRLRDAATRRIVSQFDHYLVQATRVDPRLLLAADVPEPLPPGAVAIQAEQPTRADVKITLEGFGQGIGIIESAGRDKAFAEYRFQVPAAGTYELAARYASGEARPVRLLLNGAELFPRALGAPTGGFFPVHQRWERLSQLSLSSGEQLLRLEQTESALPHVDRFALLPIQAEGRPSPENSPETLARKLGLDAAILRRVAGALGSRRQERIFGPFRALAELPESGFPSAAAALVASWKKSPPENWNRLVVEALTEGPPPDSLQAAAGRFRDLAVRVNLLWLRLSTEGDRPVNRLPVADEEAVRRALYDASRGVGLDAVEETYPEMFRTRLAALRKEVAELEANRPKPSEMALAVEDARPENCRIHLRGNHLTLGAEAPRVMPEILAGRNRTPVGARQSGRLELAEWLANPDNPLTARVMVNRVWQHHFGEGLVRSSDNFGILGDRPTHPELLDWLAAAFVRPAGAARTASIGAPGTAQPGLGWSLKALHRLILNSSAYLMGSNYDSRSALADPENRLLWRFNRRRLEVEAIRDSVLAVAGELDPAMGGSLLKTPNFGYVTNDQSANQAQYDIPRRSIYLPVIRNAVYDVFQAFDFVEPSFPNGKRSSTTVAPQALFLMNSPLVLAQSRALAAKLLRDASLPDQGARLERLYRLAYGRSITAEELREGAEFIREAAAKLPSVADPAARSTAALAAYCQLVFASSEFITVD